MSKTVIFVAQPIDKSPVVEPWETGVIKFFDPVRRWGFITPDEGDTDIFLPWTILQRYGIPEREACQGIRVRFKWEPDNRPGRRPKATHIMLIRAKR